MKTTKIVSTVILVFVPVLLFACATAKSQYEHARKINTVSAYQEFLSKYPSGEYAEQAQNRIEALNFEKAQAVNTVDAYESFMQTSNSELFKTYAIQRIQKIYGDEYSKAKESDTIEAYKQYMIKYPKSDYLPDCMERIEYFEWMSALKRHDAVGYYKYLNNCSVCGKHNQEAQKRFESAVKSGEVVDFSLVKNRIKRILSRNDIVVVQSRSNKTLKKSGPMRLEDLSAADEVLVGPKKGAQTIGAADLKKWNDASVKTLYLKKRVPISGDNPIGFSTIFFYPQKNETMKIIFIQDGRGYLFQETDSDIY